MRAQAGAGVDAELGEDVHWWSGWAVPAKGCKARERSVNSTPMRLFLIAAGLSGLFVTR